MIKNMNGARLAVIYEKGGTDLRTTKLQTHSTVKCNLQVTSLHHTDKN